MASTSYKGFMEEQKIMAGPPSPEQLSALESLFSNSKTSVSDVALNITRPYLRAIRESPSSRSTPAESQCSRIWRTINNAVKELTEFNDKLAELVFEIHQVSDSHGADILMTDFNQEWAEFAWNCEPFVVKQPASTDLDRETKIQAWINMNAFCSKLTTHGNPKLNMVSDADWVIRRTLEKTPWEVFHHPDIDEEEDFMEDAFLDYRDYELEQRDVRSLNYWVPGAAAWFKLNSKVIYGMEGPMSHEHDWDETNWKGTKGWSKKRFAYWIERFEWISKVTALEKSTKQLAQECADVMKRVQGNAGP
ncbi:hypothetical protein JX266_007771 [Neoarthrinium moseri]|nr:hypothetical protein JX266_007771 [Neoarthrinium moseri]